MCVSVCMCACVRGWSSAQKREVKTLGETLSLWPQALCDDASLGEKSVGPLLGTHPLWDSGFSNLIFQVLVLAIAIL